MIFYVTLSGIHRSRFMPDSIAPEIRDLLALNLVPGLGPKLTAALLRHFGSAAAIRSASTDDLRQAPRIGEKLSADFAARMDRVDVDAEYARIAAHRVQLLVLGWPGYPEVLANIPGAPHILYTRGTIVPDDRKAIAIVGSRGCTAYGKRITEQLTSAFCRAGYTIISGLARGIDAVAHQTALKSGGRTIAVLAGGLSSIYPPEHADLAAQVEQAGALISEAPMAAEPLPQMFPSRNRIISGLARAVVVVEANDRSGSLITARHAAEQGRDVFAIPGPVDSPASAGCLKLIRDGATLARHADDILEDLERSESTTGLFDERSEEKPTDQPAAPPPDLAETPRRIWEFLAGGAQPGDRLAQELGIPVPELSRSLMQLEMKRLVRRLPGSRYERW
jgi:DNA processing protein